jgi:hypothetical protein
VASRSLSHRLDSLEAREDKLRVRVQYVDNGEPAESFVLKVQPNGPPVIEGELPAWEPKPWQGKD